MSRWKQYLIFGGLVFLVQTDFVQGVAHANGFYIGLSVFIGTLLAIALMLTIRSRNRM